jgi:hypothetical protein
MPTSAVPKATKPKLPEERRSALEARRAKLDLRIRALATEERERRRREDTRGKIVLGGALLAFFRKEPVAARALLPRLLPLIAERDREMVVRLADQA